MLVFGHREQLKNKEGNKNELGVERIGFFRRGFERKGSAIFISDARIEKMFSFSDLDKE
jgi:hypothetical protein